MDFFVTQAHQDVYAEIIKENLTVNQFVNRVA